jgi:hypothetical protein
MDVTGGGIVVVDPATGNVLEGAAAVQAIIDDKRLTAVFHDVGIKSREFQAAQVHTAREIYYLAPKTFTVTDRDQRPTVTISGQFQDVLRSEAGKTALMDRAVQQGTGDATVTFKKVAREIINGHSARSVQDLARYEAVFVTRLRNRIDVLHASDLSQPPAPPP